MAEMYTVDQLIEFYIQGPIKAVGVTPQLQLRSDVIKKWGIKAGSRVLEVGCGQGDSLVLANVVGPEGHIDAIDPAPPTYGGPINLGQSQSHLKSSPLGPRMTFHTADLEAYLSSYTGPAYDYVVFFQCLWYFPSPSAIEATLHRLGEGKAAKKLLIAEWAFQATNLDAWPHVLAALSVSNLENRMEEDRSNIVSAVSPAWFKAFFAREKEQDVGLSLESEDIVVPPRGLKEGMWETLDVVREGYREKIRKRWPREKEDERARLAADMMRDAVVAAAERVEGGPKGTQSMDVWTAVIALGT
ncbi:hypothetical protein MMC25_007399 [Agyrium rufum]|nr:hypothetical protein [Agyrium rufum]